MNLRSIINPTFSILATMVVISCGESNTPKKVVNLDSLKDPLVEANKIYVKKEADEIDQYVKFHKLDMKETGTGLRYMIYKTGKGIQAQTGMVANIHYKISLLNGTVCYSSEDSGPKEFMIGQDNVESGLHEGITYLHVGDKALFILPSHLAHGLLGDEDKIPSRSSVIYDIELTSLH